MYSVHDNTEIQKIIFHLSHKIFLVRVNVINQTIQNKKKQSNKSYNVRATNSEKLRNSFSKVHMTFELNFTHVGSIVTSRISYNAIKSRGFFLYYEEIKNISSDKKHGSEFFDNHSVNFFTDEICLNFSLSALIDFKCSIAVAYSRVGRSPIQKLLLIAAQSPK